MTSVPVTVTEPLPDGSFLYLHFPTEGEGRAPGGRDPPVTADRLVHQQAAESLDDRGEGLMLGEPAQPVRHRLGGDESAAEEGQHVHDHDPARQIGPSSAEMMSATEICSGGRASR